MNLISIYHPWPLTKATFLKTTVMKLLSSSMSVAKFLIVMVEYAHGIKPQAAGKSLVVVQCILRRFTTLMELPISPILALGSVRNTK